MIFMIILLFLGLFFILGAILMTCLVACLWDRIMYAGPPIASTEERDTLAGKLSAVWYNPD